VLEGWINFSEYQAVRMIKGQVPLDKTFAEPEQMAMAVLGEVMAKANLEKETKLAAETYSSKYIDQKLNELMPRLITQFENKTKTSIEAKLGNWHMGKYWPWYFASMTGGFARVFRGPSSYSLSAKVAAIHDLTDFYFSFHQEVVSVPANKQKASDVQGAKVDLISPTTKALNFRDKTGTLNEHHEAIFAARVYNKPVQLGPSFTTGRFMEMASQAGATPQEIEALAWGLFAFWNQSYTTSKSGIHRFHFVMDMASNYGVDYDIRDDVPDAPPTEKLPDVEVK
jgi:hypothetical protein